MALNVSFKPGMKQSLLAARYFNTTAEEAMDGLIASATPRQYLISVQDGTSLRVRIWSEIGLEEEQMGELLDWLRGVQGDIRTIQSGSTNAHDHASVVEKWVAERHGIADLFLEQLDPTTSSKADMEPDLSLGVLGGRTVMISTNTLMFSRLQEGVFGLSIAQRGSYLIEQLRRA